jgi:Reverse transcriptase (RNA-dependent DNA polymerase).
LAYKGKGPQNVLDSYRGITLECVPFKILNNILLEKIHDRVMAVILRKQYGFIPGRSTTQAVGHVLQYISEALSKPKGHAYAIFINYQQAFDGVNRSRVLEKLHPVLGAESQIFKFIACIL